jgi:hypothetical protein
MTYQNEAANAKRMVDVRNAIATGAGFTQLGELWGVCRPAVSLWCARNVRAEDCAALRANANQRRADKIRDFDLVARLELLAVARAAGMSWERIGMAMGITGPALWSLAHRHAPDGLEAALNDFRDDEAA